MKKPPVPLIARWFFQDVFIFKVWRVDLDVFVPLVALYCR